MVIVARMYGATQSAGLDVVVNDDDVEAWHVLIEVFDPWSLSSDARLIRKRSRRRASLLARLTLNRTFGYMAQRATEQRGREESSIGTQRAPMELIEGPGRTYCEHW